MALLLFHPRPSSTRSGQVLHNREFLRASLSGPLTALLSPSSNAIAQFLFSWLGFIVPKCVSCHFSIVVSTRGRSSPPEYFPVVIFSILTAIFPRPRGDGPHSVLFVSRKVVVGSFSSLCLVVVEGSVFRYYYPPAAIFSVALQKSQLTFLFSGTFSCM